MTFYYMDYRRQVLEQIEGSTHWDFQDPFYGGMDCTILLVVEIVGMFCYVDWKNRPKIYGRVVGTSIQPVPGVSTDQQNFPSLF